jgi:predicted amidophosphoribosyltransferase
MAIHKNVANLTTCPRCGAATHLAGARFCGHCGASLFDSGAEMPVWQRPARARYAHVAMSRIALSCPECGEPMRFGFRKVCRRCGAKLVMVPRLLHLNHYRVYAAGPRAALTALPVEGFHLAIILTALALIVRACAAIH